MGERGEEVAPGGGGGGGGDGHDVGCLLLQSETESDVIEGDQEIRRLGG